MKKKVFEVIKIILRLGGIFSLVFLFPSYLSGDFAKDDYRMIRAAFMNGYVRALSIDMGKIESLKKNRDEMRKFVLNETEKYMGEVLKLNK